MKSASVHQIKQEIANCGPKQLEDLILRLSKYKKDNKELITYLLFEQGDEAAYLASVKELLDEEFKSLNTSSYYLMKKTVRKVLRLLKKYARYSSKVETEINLLFYFCQRMTEIQPSIFLNGVLNGLYSRQLALAEKKLLGLHPDLQFDYRDELESLKENPSS